jgi:hypothetical protein
MGATAVVELGHIALHPAKHRRLINRKTALTHQSLDIVVAQSLAQIPVDTTHNDFGLEVTPCEQGWADHRRSPVVCGQ